MRILLRDLSPGQAYAIQFRSNDGDGNVSDWSQVQRFTTTNDTIRPGNVASLSWYDSGAAFIGEWDKTVVDEQGNPFRDFRGYHCQVTDGSTAADFYVVDERFEFSKELNLATFGVVKTVLTLNVWAVDLTFNESAVAASVTVNPSAPPTPSTPTIENYLGAPMVSWNGLSNSGTTMGTNLNYCEVHVSLTSGFTPTTATFVGRVFADGSASRFVIPGLTYDSVYYIRLVPVNVLGVHGAASAQVTGTPTRLSGLHIANGQIAAEQINWTATDIPGGDAYYSTSQPTVPIGVSFNVNDVWYDTDDGYTSYKWNGTTWIAAPEIGFIPAGKLVAGTITSDKIGANEIITAHMAAGSIDGDRITVASLEAGRIKTGSIAAAQRIIAGPELENHAEVTSTGFYVKGPQPGTPVGTTPNIIDRIRMGTGVSDFFAIPDPLDPDSTLAQIDENGLASFQNLYVDGDPTIQGEKLSAMIGGKSNIVGTATLNPISIEPSGSAGIRDEYGLGQFAFPVVAGRIYEISARLSYWYPTNGGEAWGRIRLAWDTRTSTDIANGLPPTAVTNSGTLLLQESRSNMANGGWQNPVFKHTWKATATGIISAGFSMLLNWPSGSDSVIKVATGSTLNLNAVDLGPEPSYNSGRVHDQGGSLYSYTPPAPPTTQPQNFSGEYHYNWARSYKGTNAWMTNDGGKAYQGQDPSGFNGNQIGYFGFSNVDWTSVLSGAYNISVHVYLYYAHWYYNAGGTARIGFHNVYGDPGSASRSGTIQGTFDSSGWPKPGGRELDISSWASYMQSGAFRGIALGPGNNSYQNYGYATDCVIKLWYTKNV